LKELFHEHPLYGKYSSPPMHYEDWWGHVIERAFQYSHVADSGESSDSSFSVLPRQPKLTRQLSGRPTNSTAYTHSGIDRTFRF
jgi:hypothetical protein